MTNLLLGLSIGWIPLVAHIANTARKRIGERSKYGIPMKEDREAWLIRTVIESAWTCAVRQERERVAAVVAALMRNSSPNTSHGKARLVVLREIAKELEAK